MNTSTLADYDEETRRAVLDAARLCGRMTYPELDPILVEACASEKALRTLVSELDGVILHPGHDPEELLNAGFAERVPRGLSYASDDFNLYADTIRSLPRLDREGEQLMARRLEFARERLRPFVDATNLPAEARERMLERGINCATLRDEIAEITGGDPDEFLAALPCESTDPYVRSCVAEYARLRSHFVERNLYLVIGMTAAYRTYGVPVMDLIQEGNAALIRAVEKYDWRKGVRFQTYAAWWVRQAVERLITANRGIVRVPNYIQQKMRRLRREGKLPRNQKDVDLRDVSELFDTTQEAAARLMETDRSWYSLDAPLGDDDTFASLLEAEDQSTSMSASEKRALGKRIDEVLAEHLTVQERDIITLRFGLGGVAPQTLDQIGEQMSVSRERIRQMQVKALDKLQKRRLLDELRDYL